MKKQLPLWAAACCAFLVLATTGSPALGQQHDIFDDLVSYWELDGDFQDSVDDNHGTLQGTSGAPVANFVAGKFGQAIDLDRSDFQRIEITGGDESEFDFTGANVSISAWFTVGGWDQSWQALVAKGEGGGWRVARRGSADILGYAGGSSDTNGGPNVNDGAWHHMVAISDPWNAWNTQLWVDGALAATGARPNLENRANRMMIGGNPDDSPNHRSWNGNIDDVAVWSRPITGDEVVALYNAGAGASVGSLAGTMFDDPAIVEHLARTLTFTPPQGSAGAWGVREVFKFADGAGVGNLEEAAQRLNEDADGTNPGTRVDYPAQVINIWDSGSEGHFVPSDEYGVVRRGKEVLGAVENIAIVASGKMLIPATGPYTFGVNSDDGFELSIDGNVVAEFNSGRGASDTFGVANLTAGVHKIRVLNWEGGGGAELEVFAAPGQKTSFDSDFILIGKPSLGTFPVPGYADQLGMAGTVPGGYEHEVGDPPVLTTEISSIQEGLDAYAAGEVAGTNMYSAPDFVNHNDPDTGGTGNFPGDIAFPNDTAGVADDDFAVIVQGAICVPEDGLYQIGYDSDDGAALQIYGQSWLGIVPGSHGDAVIVADQLLTDALTGSSWTAGEIDLLAGNHDFAGMMFERGGGAHWEIFGRGQLADGTWDPTWHLLTTDSCGYWDDPAGLELVPEPSTWAMLLGLAAVGLLGVYRRRRNAA